MLRSDNLSAATHALPGGGRELNRRFKAFVGHYGVRSTASAKFSVYSACWHAT